MLLSMGVRVTLVENDEEHCRRLSEWLPGALVLYGDGTDQELLASEHFANNDAFVALTGRDEDNLISAPLCPAAGHPQSGGQVQPDELRCRGPGRRPGVRGGPPSSSPWPTSSGWSGVGE